MALFVIFHSFLELLREFEAADLREQIDCLASVGDLSCSSIKLWEIAERDQLISSTKEINCVRAAYVGSTSLHGIYIHIAPQGRIILHHRTSMMGLSFLEMPRPTVCRTVYFEFLDYLRVSLHTSQSAR
ncbi:hypothetical protein PVAP13_1NG501700 [Panicum virgatum]|uniref:Uncharacterized protein n=1 Tax=Panicum virgatum TaxID=38727 RepID=A0A8T0X3Q6_PANVG|nr:hypothetical protein PVAP13_1NG501700 [Panicum virgatum]KAG2654730.1 hypothetical protein PVAP13_1NG501700 [Panicum virgatum]